MTGSDLKQIVMNAKNARIIVCLSEIGGLTYDEAADIFYTSTTGSMINEGVADLHCRSDKYLATLIWEEHQGISD